MYLDPLDGLQATQKDPLDGAILQDRTVSKSMKLDDPLDGLSPTYIGKRNFPNVKPVAPKIEDPLDGLSPIDTGERDSPNVNIVVKPRPTRRFNKSIFGRDYPTPDKTDLKTPVEFDQPDSLAEDLVKPAIAYVEKRAKQGRGGLSVDEYNALPVLDRMKIDAKNLGTTIQDIGTVAATTPVHLARSIVQGASGLAKLGRDEFVSAIAPASVGKIDHSVGVINLLRAGGMPDWIAESPELVDKYVANLGMDPNKIDAYMNPDSLAGDVAGLGRTGVEMAAPMGVLKNTGMLGKGALSLYFGGKTAGETYNQLEPQAGITAGGRSALAKGAIDATMIQLPMGKVMEGTSGNILNRLRVPASVAGPVSVGIPLVGEAALYTGLGQQADQLADPKIKDWDNKKFLENLITMGVLRGGGDKISHDLPDPAARYANLPEGRFLDQAVLPLENLGRGGRNALGDADFENLHLAEAQRATIQAAKSEQIHKALDASPEENQSIRRYQDQLAINNEDQQAGRPISFPNLDSEINNLTPKGQLALESIQSINQEMYPTVKAQYELKGRTVPNYNPGFTPRMVIDHEGSPTFEYGTGRTKAPGENSRTIMNWTDQNDTRNIGSLDNSSSGTFRVPTEGAQTNLSDIGVKRVGLNKVLNPIIQQSKEIYNGIEARSNMVGDDLHKQAMDEQFKRIQEASDHYDETQTMMKSYEDAPVGSDGIRWIKTENGNEASGPQEMRAVENEFSSAHKAYLNEVDKFKQIISAPAWVAAHDIAPQMDPATSALMQHYLTNVEGIGYLANRYGGDPRNVWTSKNGDVYHMTQATTDEASKTTGHTYSDNPLANSLESALRFNSAHRNALWQKELLNQRGYVDDGSGNPVPEGFGRLSANAERTFPLLKNAQFPEFWQRRLDEFATPNKPGGIEKLLTNVSQVPLNASFKAFPIFHLKNEVTHGLLSVNWMRDPISYAESHQQANDMMRGLDAGDVDPRLEKIVNAGGALTAGKEGSANWKSYMKDVTGQESSAEPVVQEGYDNATSRKYAWMPDTKIRLANYLESAKQMYPGRDIMSLSPSEIEASNHEVDRLNPTYRALKADPFGELGTSRWLRAISNFNTYTSQKLKGINNVFHDMMMPLVDGKPVDESGRVIDQSLAEHRQKSAILAGLVTYGGLKAFQHAVMNPVVQAITGNDNIEFGIGGPDGLMEKIQMVASGNFKQGIPGITGEAIHTGAGMNILDVLRGSGSIAYNQKSPKDEEEAAMDMTKALNYNAVNVKKALNDKMNKTELMLRLFGLVHNKPKINETKDLPDWMNMDQLGQSTTPPFQQPLQVPSNSR